MKKRTILNLLLILFILSFFVTPLCYESKILLQRIFASSVDIIPADKAQKIDSVGNSKIAKMCSSTTRKLKERNPHSCISSPLGEVLVLPTSMQ